MKARIRFAPVDAATLAFDTPVQVLTAPCVEQVQPVLAAAHAAAKQGYWVVGCVAYEAAPAFDRALSVRESEGSLPLAVFAVYESPVPGAAKVEGSFRCGPWQAEISRARFDTDMAGIEADIRAGRFYQTNHTTRLRADFAGDAEALFNSLVQAQPGGYSCFLDGGPEANWQILSVSPELSFDWSPDGLLTTRPMKGTAPRFADPSADQAAADALRASAKEQAENLMIVDLLRNDLSRVAQTGSVDVPHLFDLEALPSLWQMTSTVQCKTCPSLNLTDVFAALFPCGSITGAPKVTAMQSIAEREMSPRGAYCGALGIIRPGGHATFSVGIRTVVIEGDRAECGIGSGITIDARPDSEFAEWQAKRRFLWRASAGFQLLETLRLEAGEYWLLERHLARMAASAEHFGFAWNYDEAARVLTDLVQGKSQGAWRVRLLADRDGRFTAEAHALEPTPDEYRVRLATTPVQSDNEFLRHKTTERGVYGAHQPEVGLFDVLLYNERDELTEFTKGNVVVELDGRLLTPSLACGLLPGALRAELLATGEIAEAIITRADLARATGLWFINGVRGRVRAKLA
ncbi:MAG TPA: chorismate-binding protein [Rhodocyclaceae bacterium]|nr:chorismate-binding protein [Rhodocyclaceae bacterium]